MGSVVHPHPVTCGPAEEAVHGFAGHLAGDVPQRMVDSGQGGPRHLSQRKPHGVLGAPEQPLDARRVLAHEPGLHLVDGCDYRFIGTDRIGLPVPGHALIGVHLEKHGVTASVRSAKCLYVGDFQGLFSRTAHLCGRRSISGNGYLDAQITL